LWATAVEHYGRYEIGNIDDLRHALNEFRPLIQSQNEPVYYQAIHNLLNGMLRLNDSTQGTTIRVYDTTRSDVTHVFIRWLAEANKALKFVLKSLDYGYLYNGILQHSDPEYSTRFLQDFTSGELNYILWKHAHCLNFLKAMLGRYYFVIPHLTSPRSGSL
jgi:hypothetical protein